MTPRRYMSFFAELEHFIQTHRPLGELTWESRLGREQIETAYALKQILDADVHVFFYIEDRERVLETAMDKVLLSPTNFAAEVERERARQRTYDAMLRKARALQVTGGKVYGYDNVKVFADTRRLPWKTP